MSLISIEELINTFTDKVVELEGRILKAQKERDEAKASAKYWERELQSQKHEAKNKQLMGAYIFILCICMLVLGFILGYLIGERFRKTVHGGGIGRRAEDAESQKLQQPSPKGCDTASHGV